MMVPRLMADADGDEQEADGQGGAHAAAEDLALGDSPFRARASDQHHGRHDHASLPSTIGTSSTKATVKITPTYDRISEAGK